MSNEKLVLALNSGSSSLKASLLSVQGDAKRVMTALAERLSTQASVLHITIHKDEKRIAVPNMDHDAALIRLTEVMTQHGYLQHVVAVGHRVVHGGTKFMDSVVIDDHVLQEIQQISHLAPLHNPANVAGIRAMQRVLDDSIPQVAVFDTSFHSTIPEFAYTYPLPKEYRDHDMRKFGFHGTSVKYVSQRAVQQIPKDGDLAMIVCHLGSGASVTAVVGDKSMDTTMGFTPLAGLMMGTRSGSFDPSLVAFACRTLDKTMEEVMTDVNKRSGLRGVIEGEQDDEHDYDMRTLLKNQHDHGHFELAVRMFVYRLAQHIASMMIALQRTPDAIVFTAGIGEHSPEIRQRTMNALKPVLGGNHLLDPVRNEQDGTQSNGILSKDGVWPMVLDIPTDEEAMIAQESLRLTKL